MKGFIVFAIGIILLHNTRGGETCKKLLLESYFFVGRRAPVPIQHALCHTIQQNCVSTDDVIKMHRDAGTSLDSALLSFKEKMRRAFSDIKALNGMIQKQKYEGSSTKEQSDYCAKAEVDFRKINFEKIDDKLTSGFDKMCSESKDYHLAFYCMLSDFKAHQVIDTSKKTVTVAPKTCMARIVNNKDYVYALNVDLINYFKAAQKFLDCISYDNFYDFPFLFKEEGESADKAKKCLDKTSDDPKFMPPDCTDFCGRISIGGISANLEGDPIFLDKITDYLRGMILSTNRRKELKRSNFQPFVHLDKFEVELTDPKARKLTKTMLFPGRMLAEDNKKKNFDPPGAGATVEELVAYYEEYYNEITFETNPESKELLKLQTDPFNIQEFKVLISADDSAIDLTSYFNGLNFDVNKTELTKNSIVEVKKKAEVDPYIEALCLIGSASELKLITDDVKLNPNIVVPDEFITASEKTYASAAVVEKEVEEIVDSEEAEKKKGAEKKDGAAAAPTTTDKKRRRLAKRNHHRRYRRTYSRHHNRRYNRRNHRSHKRRLHKYHKSHKYNTRRRKLEALLDFDTD